MGELRISGLAQQVGELSEIMSPGSRPDRLPKEPAHSTEVKMLIEQLNPIQTPQNFSILPAEASSSMLSASNVMNHAFIQESSAEPGNEILEVESNMLGELHSELRRLSPPDTNASPNADQSMQGSVDPFSIIANEGSSKIDACVSAAKISKSQLSWRRSEPYSTSKAQLSKKLF